MKTIVKNSAIHGKGLFAKEHIKEDELIGTFECRPTKDNGIYVLWIEEDQGEFKPYQVVNDMKFANHGPNPNSELYETQLYASRSILPHEEITFHYGNDWD